MKRLDEIFDITYGSQLDLNKCDICQRPYGYNFVNRSIANSGASSRILKLETKQPFPAGCITSAMGGSVLSSFVQQEDFYTGQNVKVLVPKQEMLLAEKLYYCTCIERNRFRFSTFGREANATFNSLLVPDYDEILSCIKEKKIEYDFKEEPIKEKKQLDAEHWQWFSIKEIFNIEGSKTTSKIKLEDIGNGLYPYVTTQAVNNGIENYFNCYTEEGNVFTVDSAVLGYCAYQIKKFSASDHVEKLVPKFKCNIYIAMFIVTLINREQYRYNYGRKCSQTKLQISKIKLPATKEGTPDWEFMEDYIKSLPYSSCL